MKMNLKITAFMLGIFAFTSCQKNDKTPINQEPDNVKYKNTLMSSGGWEGVRDLNADYHCKEQAFVNCVVLPPVIIRPSEFPTGSGVYRAEAVFAYFDSVSSSDWFTNLSVVLQNNLLSGDYEMILSESDSDTSTYKFYNPQGNVFYMTFLN